MSALTLAEPAPELVDRLSALCEVKGLPGLAERLRQVGTLANDDLTEIEAELGRLFGDKGLVLHQGARHLLDLAGKRLRPLCVALAARLGKGVDDRARSYGVAVEMVHSATLLHDDVIDFGEVRRKVQTARVVYGDAVSIYAGDWLLVSALRRVREAGVSDVLVHLLDVLDVMLHAESLQLSHRGSSKMTLETYNKIIEGKTASLFSWALHAGGRAGGVAPAAAESLKQFGTHMGVAFQIADDLLDYVGNPERTGKTLFADLREGKMTLPLILGVELDPKLSALLEELLQNPADRSPPRWLVAQIGSLLHASGALTACRAAAEKRVQLAVSSVAALPNGEAKDSLIAIAHTAVAREV